MVFLDDADETRIFKGNRKLSTIINITLSHIYILVFLWNPVNFCKFYLWEKDVFTFYQVSG